MAGLYFYYSTMNAGKSSSLLQSNYNYLERGMKTLVLKPGIDTREGKAVIRSRIGLEAECQLFQPDDDLFNLVKGATLTSWAARANGTNGDIHCVFIDEAQFMSDIQIKQLARVVDELDIPVLCYGLRTDFQGNLFPGSAALLGWANKLIELKTICWCGNKAHMVLRVDETGAVVKEGAQVQVGGNDSYVSVCRKHFTEGRPS